MKSNYHNKKRSSFTSKRFGTGRKKSSGFTRSRKRKRKRVGSYEAFRMRSKIRLAIGCTVTAAVLLCGFVFLPGLFGGKDDQMSFHPVESTGEVQDNWEQTTSLEETPKDEDLCLNIRQRSEWNLVLVNPKVELPESYLSSSQIVTAFEMEMDSRIEKPYTQMYKAAVKDGISLWISSCYRSKELQKELYEREIEENVKSGMSQEEATAAADVAVARPGYSEHNTGLAIDFNGVTMDFENTKAFQWLQENAADYGFVLRFPKGKEFITHIMYEPWHYRYVGVEHAQKMKELDMCLEEYLYYLQEKGE